MEDGFVGPYLFEEEPELLDFLEAVLEEVICTNISTIKTCKLSREQSTLKTRRDGFTIIYNFSWQHQPFVSVSINIINYDYGKGMADFVISYTLGNFPPKKFHTFLKKKEDNYREHIIDSFIEIMNKAFEEVYKS